MPHALSFLLKAQLAVASNKSKADVKQVFLLKALQWIHSLKQRGSVLSASPTEESLAIIFQFRPSKSSHVLWS